MKDKDLLSLYSPFVSVWDTAVKLVSSSINKENFVVPTAPMLINSSPELRSELVRVFKSKGGVVEGSFGNVPYPVQVMQGALLSSLLFGFHKSSGKVALYTASESHIQAFSPGYEFSVDKMYKQNVEGILHAVRVDLEYTSKEDFNTKLTRLTVKTHLVNDDYIFIPYEAVHIVCEIISQSLSRGQTLYVDQVVAGVRKERFISNNAKVLSEYTDHSGFARELSKKRIPQVARAKGYFPVVGATADTTGLTSVNFFAIDTLMRVKDNGTLAEVSVFSGGIRLVVLSVLSNSLASVYSNDTVSEYNNYIEGIVDVITQQRFLEVVENIETPKDMPEDAIVSLQAANLILRDLNDQDLQNVWLKFKEKGIPYDNAQDLVKFVSGKYNVVEGDYSPERLKEMFASGIYKVVTTKKDGSFSTMYVTNNEDLLYQVYGADYKKNFESIGVRIREARKYIQEGMLTFDEVMEYLGFDEFIGKGVLSAAENLEIFNNLVSSELNYSPRSYDEKPNLVMARRVFGVVTPKGVEGYYCNVDVTKIYEIVEVY